MRFSLDLALANQAITETRREVLPSAAVVPTRPEGINYGVRYRALQVLAGLPGEAANTPRAVVPREGEDRRRLCRRIFQLQVMLDTRTGRDRRKEARRSEDDFNHFAQHI